MTRGVRRSVQKRRTVAVLAAVVVGSLARAGAVPAVETVTDSAKPPLQLPYQAPEVDCRPVVPPAPPSNTVPAISDAVHILQPLGSEARLKGPLDTSLTSFMAVVLCASGRNCDALGAKTGDVRLQGQTYRQAVDIPNRLRGQSVLLKIYVAGLVVADIPYSVKSNGVVNVQLQIAAHPRIRARVLHAQGRNAAEVAALLKAEFNLSGYEAAAILHDEEFRAVDVGPALSAVYGVAPEEMALWLRSAGFEPDEIIAVLYQIFSADPSAAAKMLRDTGFSAAAAYDALKEVSPARTIEQNELDLQQAGFCLDDVFNAIQLDLVKRYTAWINDLGPVLQLKAGEDDPPGPDPQFLTEIFNPASMEWFLERSFVQWTLPNCPPVDVVNGTMCNTPAGAVRPDTLVNLIERFRSDLPLLTSYGVDTGDPRKVQEFLGYMNFRVVPRPNPIAPGSGKPENYDPIVLGGESTMTPAYVNVIRNKTPGTKEFGTTDLQFWYFYPFNGPGRVRTVVHEVVTTFTDERYIWPLATHIPDWELIVLRVSNIPFADGSPFLLKVMGSAHGDVNTYWESWAAPAHCDVPFACKQTPSMIFYDNQARPILNETGVGAGGHHPLLLASGNGHAIYPLYGPNDDPPMKDLTFSALNIGIKLYSVNWTSFGRSLPSPGHSELMSVYDTCVYAGSSFPGICQGINPVQVTNNLFSPTALDDYAVPMGNCRFPGETGGLLIRPWKDGKFLGEMLDHPNLFPAAHMSAICPRAFTVRADGSVAPDASWFFTGHFGPEPEYTMTDEAWTDWVHDALFDLFLVGLNLPGISDIVDAILELIKEPFLREVYAQPRSPESPLWKGCGLGRYDRDLSIRGVGGC